MHRWNQNYLCSIHVHKYRRYLWQSMPGLLIMPRCACAKSIQYSWFVYLCVYLYVCNSDFSKVTKNQALLNVVQPQHSNISNLIVLDFWIKLGFVLQLYGMICSPRTLLWHVPNFPDDQSARSGSPCILILESTQQIQLLSVTVKLHSKHSILVNWI